MQEATTQLWDWLAITDEPTESDLIFLFGGAIIATAEKGAELYDRGLGAKVLAAGNTGTYGNPDWRRPSAQVFAAYLRRHGVPDAAILTQPTSTNTLEDVTQSLKLMQAERIPHSKVILVSRPLHQRRAFATYQMHDPGAQVVNAPCSEVHPSKLSGDRLKEVAVRCCEEYERLAKYADKGDLVKQVVPQSIFQAYQILCDDLARIVTG